MQKNSQNYEMGYPNGCVYCSEKGYNPIWICRTMRSNDDVWISFYSDGSADLDIDLNGDSISIGINYCPICGRKFEITKEELTDNGTT